MDLFRSVKSDLYKLRHTLILWMHILIPLLCSVIFLAYYSISSWKAKDKVSAYFEFVAVTFPLLIGLICSMVVSQEEQAGNFQELLTGSKWRWAALISKLILFILGSFFFIFIALSIFGIGFQYVLNENNFTLSCYVQVGIGLLLGNIILYILHTFLSLRYGKGASIGGGIVGSLICAIMITGLGDRIWKVIPWAWAVRFCDYSVLSEINSSLYNMVQSELKEGVIIMAIDTLVALVMILIWFSSWEGRKSLE
ncbi:lantibiotic immunity ABC transporter MutG family permease subunit [Clostridium sp.]|jgi:lantibiotic transport system permease protein|uniref:lantibiotic immunity ABC transporter MutG family permease subunit n=1 Tax=Clostridium sp. TaxID=1506 RepID=UPI0039F55CB7